jgi:AraC-like DNA-binding protein
MKTRIQESCELLRVTGATIAEVATTVGFYDQSAFTGQFRRQMGLTPRKYQMQYRR